MGKSKEILKCFMIVIYMDIFFLGAELMAAYIESKPIKIISCINISCFSILLILTIIKLVRKDNELSMYSSLLLFGCSISWMMPMLLYGSLFGKNTGIVTGILYAISIGIGILIPIVQGKVNKNKPFWIAIRKIAAIFTTCSISVLIVLGRVFRGGHGGRLMQKTISISSTGKLMWGGIFIIKKEYDSRKYLGYIYLLISLGLMLQTVIQGNIPVESIVKICIAGYTATLVVGFLVGLYATRKIIVKNKFVKEMLHVGCTILGFLIIFICSTGRMFFGRRGAILVEMTGGQKNSGRCLWYIILGMTCLFNFISILLITCVAVEPDHFKEKKQGK